MLRTESSRLANTLQKVCKHWESRRLQGDSRAYCTRVQEFTITLAREAGTPDGELARAVGAKLGWKVYDHELLERIASEMGLRTNLLESVDEKHGSWVGDILREAMAAVAQVPAPSEDSYACHLIETVLSLGMLGQCVIVGRGAAQLLPTETTLRVRLVAPFNQRLSHLQRELGLSRAAAERKLCEIERQRRAFVLDHFHKDPADPDNYDLLLNTARLSVDDCADMIIACLDRLQLKRGDEVIGAVPGVQYSSDPIMPRTTSSGTGA
jgi:cytidylate kinase